LSKYNLEIHHIKGTANRRADALSRRPNYNQGDRDNENVTVLPDHMFVRALTMQHMGMPKHPNQILTIQDMTLANPSNTQDKAIICPWVDPHKLKKIDGIWYKDRRRVVTKSRDQQTIKIVECNYWWPTLQQDIQVYIQGCAECQQHKVNNHPIQAALQPIFPKS
jgi:hypothetical protein